MIAFTSTSIVSGVFSFSVVVFAFVCFVNTVFFESLDNHYIEGGSL